MGLLSGTKTRTREAQALQNAYHLRLNDYGPEIDLVYHSDEDLVY